MNLSSNPEVDAYLNSLETPQQEIVLRLRLLALEAKTELTESIKWRNCLVFTLKKNLTQMVVGKEHVTVIFFDGVQLTGPIGWLEGEGKKTRSVRFKSPDFDGLAFQDLIRQAADLHR